MSNHCISCIFKSKAAETLGEADVKNLSCNNAIVKFRKGNPIIIQGVFSSHVVYLRTGLAKIHITGPYFEQIVRIVKAPCHLGLPTTIGDRINQYSVTAITNAEVCFIDIGTFRHLLKEAEHFSFEIILELCRNELDSIRRCASRTQKQTRGKIADVLLEFANYFFESDSFLIPLSQAEIGNLVDTSRESVSRILAEFHKESIIEVKGKKIIILNRKSLRMISQNG